ncbi:malic enzyme-like protein [Frankia tisae]|uniref:malic enzyme-like protein n=1 Tax=Frankia tisae TaxID=2950104 RepID=UPI0021BE08BC|nr:malic enzyme-like protein [Frankia tisae]
MTPNPPGAKPAYSIRIRVPGPAAATVTTVVSDAPGTITVHADESDPAGDRHITLDADGGPTLRWLVSALRQRLGADLLLAEDLVFVAASTGKLVQRACAATTTSHDLALSDADADRRVIDYLAGHPRHVDRFTGRSRRVALLTDASAVLDFEPLAPEAALPAVESQALHLHLATGLDVVPLPVAARDPADLATAIGMLAPGFAATVLVHTHLRRVDAARAALASDSHLLLDAVNDGLAVATTAAVLNYLRARGVNPGRARVAVVDPARGGDLSGLLIAVGVGDLTLYDPIEYGIRPLHRLAADLDLIVDLIGLAAPPEGVFVLRARPETPPPLAAATSGPRPLHALPGLLRAAVNTRQPITLEARAAAVHALVAATPSGGLLPPLDHPRLTPAVAAAATHALAAGC